jgi:multisubunit Na+/H+ antiporter MnhF subunit
MRFAAPAIFAMFESGYPAVAAAAVLTLAPAAVRLVRGPALARRPDDPMLPERLMALNRTVTLTSAAAMAVIGFAWTSWIAWLLPLSVAAQTLAAIPLRRTL